MSKKILLCAGIFAVCVLVVIAGFFLLEIERIALNHWSLGCLLFSLTVGLGTAIFLSFPNKNREGIFFRAGICSAAALYAVAVIITTALTRTFSNESFGGFIFMHIVVNALYFIAVAIIIFVSAQIHRNNVKTLEKKENGDYDQPKRGGF